MSPALARTPKKVFAILNDEVRDTADLYLEGKSTNAIRCRLNGIKTTPPVRFANDRYRLNVALMAAPPLVAIATERGKCAAGRAPSTPMKITKTISCRIPPTKSSTASPAGAPRLPPAIRTSRTGEVMHFEVPLPDDMEKLVEALRQ